MYMKTKFSVIISVYLKDDPEWFKQALESIVDQSVQPSEILITQDGPINIEAEKVISEFKDNLPLNTELSVIAATVNQGRGEMLRRAVNNTTHSVVAIMDSDDIAHRGRFAKQLKAMDLRKVDVVGSWVEEVDPDTLQPYAIKKVPQYQDEIYAYAKWRNPINQMSVIFKKQAVISAGNYENCDLFEDMWLWCRMIYHGKSFYNLPEVLVSARAGRSMHSRRTGIKYMQKEFQFLYKLYKYGYYDLKLFLASIMYRIPFRLLPISIYGLVMRLPFFRGKM